MSTFSVDLASGWGMAPPPPPEVALDGDDPDENEPCEICGRASVVWVMDHEASKAREMRFFCRKHAPKLPEKRDS